MNLMSVIEHLKQALIGSSMGGVPSTRFAGSSKMDAPALASASYPDVPRVSIGF
jgi:hypothetical protein